MSEPPPTGPGPDARETERLRKLEALAELLPMIGRSLDVREVFDRVSEVAKRVLPHDAFALVLLTEDRERVRIYAVSADADFSPPEAIPLPAHEREFLLGEAWEFIILDDMLADERWKDLPPARAGYRSSLRVSIRLDDHGLLGGINFMSRAPRAFSDEDVPVARRVADCVALALSHQRLAEEAQRAAAARERAAQLERRVEALTDELASLSGSGRRVVGRSAAWQHVLHEATRVAPTETTVLLTGESGTGKEVVARFIHHASPRAHGPFTAVNCAALPEHLLESELFGFERGAFTGATQAKPGRLEIAGGGVLFLDEVAEMSGAVQAKLLRVLQEREFQRLGGTRTLKADVRILAATNRDLRRLVERGEFREDLYYRLHVFEIRLPPLRERTEDVLPLCRAFLDEIARGLGRPPAGLSREAHPVLLAYSWPGNARELRNVLERASILADGGLITREHLGSLEGSRGVRTDQPPTRPAEPLPASPAPPATAPLPPPAPLGELASVERALVEQALREARFNKTRAARRLGLTRSQLYVRLRRYGIE